MGTLLYTATVSPGYYGDRSECPMVGLFSVIWIGTMAAFVRRLTA